MYKILSIRSTGDGLFLELLVERNTKCTLCFATYGNHNNFKLYRAAPRKKTNSTIGVENHRVSFDYANEKTQSKVRGKIQFFAVSAVFFQIWILMKLWYEIPSPESSNWYGESFYCDDKNVYCIRSSSATVLVFSEENVTQRSIGYGPGSSRPRFLKAQVYKKVKFPCPVKCTMPQTIPYRTGWKWFWPSKQIKTKIGAF